MIADVAVGRRTRAPQATAEESVPALEVAEVYFSYGHARILDGVSLRIGKGEAVTLLGTNGAGKSTLLRVISGLNPPGSGRIRLDGSDVTTVPAEERARMGISLAVGGKGVFPELTVRENLALGGYRVAPAKAGRVERVERELVRFPRLATRVNTLAGALSGGEQQQLVLAIALLRNPWFLCIDELSLGLAPVVVGQLLEVVRGVHESGVTCLIVEQSLNIAARLCDRAVFMEKGVVRFDGRAAELLDRPDLARSIFLGKREEMPS